MLRARRTQNDIFQVPKESNCQPVLVYTAKLPLIIEGEVKTFHHKQKLKEFMTSKPALQKILKGIIHTEEEDKHNQEDRGKIKSDLISSLADEYFTSFCWFCFTKERSKHHKNNKMINTTYL
jgi:hypothetical protein